MRPAPRVYGIDLHLDKSGLSLHLPNRRLPGNLSVAARPCNLTSEEMDLYASPLRLRQTDGGTTAVPIRQGWPGEHMEARAGSARTELQDR